ncbi:MAG: FG-GAP-like repeat-containing protein, partial [Candidatus Aegiribacteria sp.]
FTGSTTGITSGDFNNDGYPDLYLGNYSEPGCKLFRNGGDGTFTDVTVSAGVTGHTDTRTVAFADYNNDGWLDIFVSHHDFFTYSNIMWRNNGDGTFSDVGEQLQLSGEFMGDYFGVAWGDYNLDGDVDLFAVGHIDKYVLFRNDQSETIPSNYVVLELEGTLSNRDAVGARVTADIGDRSLTRWVEGGSGYHDFHSFPLEFGLYDAEMIDELTVYWPSGLAETYSCVGAEQYVYAVEGDTLYTGLAQGQEGPAVSGPTLSCGPNPFGGLLSVRYRGDTGDMASLEVYDLSGRLVRSFGGLELDGSLNELVWDGRDGSGSPAAGGVYLLRLESPGGSAVRRVTLLR